MADIAVQASVAVQTVYFLFHNKPALMRAAFEYAVHGDHLRMSPAQRPWFMAMHVAGSNVVLMAVAPDEKMGTLFETRMR